MTNLQTIPTETRHELYTEVLQHYARQMRLLDERDLAGYAATFTEDGVFSHSPDREPARTRAGILAELEAFHEQFATDPMARRHHFSQVDVDPRPDGTIAVVCYALVVIKRPDSAPEIRASCVVHDVLVREDGGLFNRSRRVEID
jgi:actinorhodin biosynthesis protein ActVIA